MSLSLLDGRDGTPHQAEGMRGKLALGKPANAVAIAVSASPIALDSNNEPIPVMIYVGAAGNVTVTPYGLKGSNSVTFTAVPAGTMLPVAVTAVTAASAGSPDLVAIW